MFQKIKSLFFKRKQSPLDLIPDFPDPVNFQEAKKIERQQQSYNQRKEELIKNIEHFEVLKEKYNHLILLLKDKKNNLNIDLLEKVENSIKEDLMEEKLKQEMITSLFNQLAYLTNEKIAENYEKEIVEIVKRPQIIFLSNDNQRKEFMNKYKKDYNILIDTYLEEYRNYRKDNFESLTFIGKRPKVQAFKNIDVFENFIKENNLYKEEVLTDFRFDILNSCLEKILGKGTGKKKEIVVRYSINCENYIKVKELYPKEIEYFTTSKNYSENPNMEHEFVEFSKKISTYLLSDEILVIR